MSRTQRSPFVAGALAAALLLALAGTASWAQTIPACPPVQLGQELREIPSLYPVNGILSTTFRVELKRQCVPVLSGSTWSNVPMNLRTYVYPDSSGDQLRWGFPGPTLHLRKPGTPFATGDSLAILLVNNLPAEASTTTPCDSACPATTVCPTDPALLPDPTTCPGNSFCCCWVNRTQSAPNCFHGDNTTNLHFHGLHVSPQAPQDYVLLELHPNQPADTSPPAHEHGTVAYGQYQYRLDPLLYTQSEGTFWYHPHKHGSVSLQVSNGMPGALLVEGPFDDWLKAYYQGNLKEKLLIVQQIQEKTALYGQGAAPTLLVNGQARPVVTMAPGEVQRWRFVNATLQAAAQVSIYFPSGAVVRQIAMDGIQFAPENYSRQPLFSPSDPTAFNLSPGNRADFLVQAPTITGTYPLSYEVFGNLGELSPETLRKSGLADGARQPLVTLVVKAPEKGAVQEVATGLPAPAQWPPLPAYLSDIVDSEIVAKENLLFGMSAGPRNPTAKFLINGKQFDPSCNDVTTRLGTAEEWTVGNSSELEHPFHIHTNPFQLLQNGATMYARPWVWMDTIAVPAGTAQTPQTVHLRQRYEDFTGGYVLHCHFLGHEDRGMMFGSQTVCPQDSQDTLYYGKPQAGGGPECVPGNLIPAAPRCPAITSEGSK
jgi:FtsP/CotA-like multicopper oxidase with cupredoxin domain